MAVKDVAGISRIGAFEKITLPSGTVVTPTGGTGTTTRLRTDDGRTVDVPSAASDPHILEHYVHPPTVGAIWPAPSSHAVRRGGRR